MTIKQKFSSIDQSKLTADQKSFLDKIKNVTKNFTDSEMNKKVEQPLDNFIAKAKEKMPEAIKSAPAKRTTKAKAKPSQTRKPKRTVMSVAKEIRKEGESWKEAQERAKKMMKEDSQALSKTVESELDKLSKLVRSQKDREKLAGISGTDIKRDASRKAKPRGARKVTHSGETSNQYGTFSNHVGRKYYESRDRHSDRLAPRYPKNAPLLAEGGYLTDPTFGNFQNQVFADGGDIDAFTLRMVKSNGIQPAEVLKENANVMYKKGGSVTNERKHVNHDEDYEVRYAKPRPSRKGYKGVRAFELGGTIVTDLAGHTGGSLGGDPTMLDGVSGTHYTGLVGETGAMSSGEMFMNGGTLPAGAEQSYMITESFGNPAQHFAKGGGVARIYEVGIDEGDKKGTRTIADFDTEKEAKDFLYEYKLKHPRAKLFIDSSKSDFFYSQYGTGSQYDTKKSMAKGGGVRKVGNREYSYGRNWTNDHNHTNKGEEHEVKYTRKGKFLGVFNKGGSLTNERKHINHSEDYEVRYAKPRPHRKGYKGKRSFADGGGIGETPRIYVADLEAYNNGRLEGEWLDLADYNDADELMDAIQDVLKKSGGEEYAIHDVEYIPSGMYSEYMGQKDFEELYQMIDLAKDNDLPLEVVQQVVSQYGESAVEDFVGKYDSPEDFAIELADDLGIESFIDFQYYLEISETDRRLLSQEMADSYVDDIRDEDGGNRLIQEADLDVEEYEEADSDRQEEMLDEARELVYDEYYDNWYMGLSDPYYFLVEEQGLYDAESFAKADFVRVDYEKLGDALEQDYAFVYNDGDLYVFNVR